MDVVGHDAQCIELEIVFIYCLLNGVEKHFSTFASREFKFAVIATGSDVVRVSGFDIARFSRHKELEKMLAEDYVLIGNDKNLPYIAEHKRVFEVEHLYPLDIFETFA